MLRRIGTFGGTKNKITKTLGKIYAYIPIPHGIGIFFEKNKIVEYNTITNQ